MPEIKTRTGMVSRINRKSDSENEMTPKCEVQIKPENDFGSTIYLNLKWRLKTDSERKIKVEP